MQAHGRPSWYSWVVVVLVPLTASIGVLVVSLRVNSNAIDRERQARIESQRAFCGIVVLLDDAYSRTPPATPAGRDLARAVATARVANHCPPRA